MAPAEVAHAVFESQDPRRYAVYWPDAVLMRDGERRHQFNQGADGCRDVLFPALYSKHLVNRGRIFWIWTGRNW